MGKRALRVRSRLAVFTAAMALQSIAHSGVIEFEDKDAWIAAVGGFTTIDFTEYPPNTFVTDHYSDLGVLFADGDDIIGCCDSITFPEDGAGLDGNGNITLLFDTPHAWIAADFPGHLRIALYRDGELFYTSNIFGISKKSTGHFGGLISDDAFDMAVLMDLTIDAEAEIDNLYFGVPAPGALWMLGLAIACIGRCRRRACR